MDISKMLLTNNPGSPEKMPGSGNAPTPDQLRAKQLAKEFESVLLEKMMSQAKDSISSLGTERDSSAEQIEGMFWSMLGQEMGRQGGIGIWKDVYQFVTDTAEHSANENSDQGQSLDELG